MGVLSRAYVCNLYLQNHWVSFHLLVSYLNWSLLISCTFRINEIDYTYWCQPYSVHFTTLMGTPPLVVVTSSLRITTTQMCDSAVCLYTYTGLHYTYGCHWRHLRLIDAFVWEPYLQNHWVTLHLLVFSLRCSLWLLCLLTQSLDHTRIMGASQSALHHTYRCATLRAACVG